MDGGSFIRRRDPFIRRGVLMHRVNECRQSRKDQDNNYLYASLNTEEKNSFYPCFSQLTGRLKGILRFKCEMNSNLS